MPPKPSAGVMLYRVSGEGVEVLISHPGGPFFANRDEGWWSIVKGELDPGEDPETAARREFEEETSQPAPRDLVSLGTATQKSGKLVYCFAGAADFDPDRLISNEIEIEWPPRTGRTVTIPEIDEVRWCTPEEAHRLLNPAQAVFIDRLATLVQV